MSDPGRARWARLTPALFALVAFGIVGGRLGVDACASLRAGDEAAARGDERAAMHGFADAVRLYLPGSPYAQAGLDRLSALADAAAARNDAAAERGALEAARAALLAARSFYTPHADRLVAIESRLAPLLAAAEDPRLAASASLEARTRWHAARLGVRPGPSPAAAAMALGGLLLWVGAAFAFMRFGLDQGLKLRPAAAGTAVAFAVGLVLFVAGLRLA